jgi:hypothetical protein
MISIDIADLSRIVIERLAKNEGLYAQKARARVSLQNHANGLISFSAKK